MQSYLTTTGVDLIGCVLIYFVHSDLTDDLGAVGNLFCDKTGTLTSNQMVCESPSTRADRTTVVALLIMFARAHYCSATTHYSPVHP